MRVALAVAVVGVLGCSDGGDPLAERAAQVRELDFFEEVEVVSMTREEYAAQAEQNAQNIDEQRLFEYGQTYGRLGFFPIDLDLVPIVAGSSSDWVGASYSPGSKRITLVGDARDDTIVHEYVHALQDQNFGIGQYDIYETSDGFLARRAVVEGDATMAQYRFVMQEEYETDLNQLNWLAAFDNLRDFSVSLLADGDYPPVFLDYPTFCYPYGLEYDAYNLTGVLYEAPDQKRPAPYDWGLEDELFTERPPYTTQEVLRRGIAADIDEVVDVALAVPPDHADRFEAFETDVLGEWYAYLLFYGAATDVTASRALGAAWDGDRALFVRDLDSDGYAVVWLSVWDDAEAAAAVVDTMWTIYGRSTGAFEPDTFAVADDGEPVWIEQREDRVVVIKNVEQELVQAFADEAFTPTSQPRLVRRGPSLAQFVSELPHRSH